MSMLRKSGLEILINPLNNLDDFGRLLGEGWKIKRPLTEMVTNLAIDEIYEVG